MADHPTACDHPSPNAGERRGGALPDMVVLHYTAMTCARSALERLCDPSAEVSAHYLISETGFLWQLVPETARAWHAGAGRWGCVDDVNSHSVGIELANTGAHPFPEPQMASLETLLAGILGRWNIRPERVIAHSDMAPLRKSDPGARFDWRRLARQGLSVWPGRQSATLGDAAGEASLSDALRRIGYCVDDNGVEACLAAFRLRFAPWKTGPAGADDVMLAFDIAGRFPVDGLRPDA